MKRMVLFSFVVLLIGSVLIQFMAKDSGYVLISLGSTTFETSFWFASTLFIVSAFGVYLLKKIFVKFFTSFSGGIGWFVARRERHTMQATRSGLLNFLVGNWPLAKQELIASAKRADFPLVSYISAAECARKSGAMEEHRFLIEQAKKQPEYRDWLLPLLEAQQYVREEKFGEALKEIKPYIADLSQHYAGLSILKDVYVKLQLWNELIELLPKIKSNKLLSGSDFQVFEENIYLSLLESQLDLDQIADEKNKATHQSLSRLQEVWGKVLPSSLKKRHRLVGGYAKLLSKIGEDHLAGPIIEQTLKAQWHSGLAELYGNLRVDDHKRRLVVAEAWLKKQPNDARLFLALGKIAVDNQLWGKAKSYFEACIKLDARPDAYLELARMLKVMGDSEGSAAIYQKGLELTTGQAT